MTTLEVSTGVAEVDGVRLHYRYRAQPTDLALDDGDFAAGRRLTMPVLALWGAVGLPARLPTLEIWREYAEDVRGVAIPECGHFIAEERPDVLLAHLRDFLA